jgi:hypothetical protein
VSFNAGQKVKAGNFGQFTSAAQYQSSVGQVIGNNADTPVAFATANVTSAFVVQAANGVGHKFTLQKSGLWAVSTTVRLPASNTTGERALHVEDSLGLSHHACSQPGSASGAASMFLGFTKYLSAGDFIAVEVFQNSGGSLTTDVNPLIAFGRIDIVGVLLDD